MLAALSFVCVAHIAESPEVSHSAAATEVAKAMRCRKSKPTTQAIPKTELPGFKEGGRMPHDQPMSPPVVMLGKMSTYGDLGPSFGSLARSGYQRN